MTYKSGMKIKVNTKHNADAGFIQGYVSRYA